MKLSSLRYALIPLCLAGALALQAEEKKDAPASPKPEKHERRIKVVVNHDDAAAGPKETVTFLGVETSPADPVLAAQLGLVKDTGLVVRRVVEDSPAAAVLKEHDLLTKFGDQILIDQHQLSVLVRGRAAGDEVALTVYRAGKETMVKVKLATREVPKLSAMGFMGPNQNFRFFHNGEWTGRDGRMPELPGLAREDIDHAVKMLGRDHFNLMVKPQIRITKRKAGDGSTVMDMNQGNIVFSDEDGTLEISNADGHRELTLKDPKGTVTFQGRITSDEDRKQLPPEVQARLKAIKEIEVGVTLEDDFDQENVAVDKIRKIRHERGPAPAPVCPPAF